MMGTTIYRNKILVMERMFHQDSCYPLHCLVGVCGGSRIPYCNVAFFKNMMHMNYKYLYGGVEQHLLGK